ncbi:MAG: ribosome maturation factor RimP [Clostridia bacterium]|nr:ribosome maturation factor RimP [Clostridia bacterium]
MAEKKSGGVAETVRTLAAPLVASLGLKLWDVRFLKEGADSILRIIIDKDGGVGIDDCVAVNDILDRPLDEADPISVPYRLQVQSPGIERELTRDAHFAAYIGADVKVKLHKPVNERKTFEGVLESFEDGTITVAAADGTLTFEKSDAVWVKLDDFKDFE